MYQPQDLKTFTDSNLLAKR